MNRQTWIALAFVLLAGVEVGVLHSLAGLDAFLGDALLRQHAQGRSPDRDIVAINIDEHSLEALADTAGRWPWPRSTHAALLEYLQRQGIAAVVFDLLFSDPDLDRPAADGYFIEVATAGDTAYFPLVILEQQPGKGLAMDRWGRALGFEATPQAAEQARISLVLPLRPLALTGRIGSINFLADADGVGRRYAVRSLVQGWAIPSLPARVAADQFGVAPPSDAIMINWRGLPGSRPSYSYADVLADAERREPQLSRQQFAGRIAVIGTTAPALHDLRRSPLSALHPGSDILAAALETLKARDWLRPASPWVPASLCLALLLFLIIGFRRGWSPAWLAAGLLLLSLPLPAAAYGALTLRWSVPVATPMLIAWLAYVALALEAYLTERQRRAAAVRMFGRFVDPRVVSHLVGGETAATALGGERRQITLLFSDIRGFTTLSESRSPEDIVELLNRYFSRQVDVIFRHGGTVDKFIGDAIMAFWGAPLDDPHQARNAVAAALQMSRVVDDLRAELGETDIEFDIGIGIHTGEAVVGFIGADNRLEYTAIGDAVNLSSRIEGLTKGVARILVSEETRARCKDDFDFQQRGRYKVKGRSAEVMLYEPRAPDS